jgi:hypothetical protein
VESFTQAMASLKSGHFLDDRDGPEDLGAAHLHGVLRAGEQVAA